MFEVEPPSHGVLGGVGQSHNDAPVQFYRFTKERKQNMEKAMYQNPFNPLTDNDQDYIYSRKGRTERRNDGQQN